MTKTVTIRVVLQPSCCNRFGLGQGFYVVTEFPGVVSQQSILCHNRVWSRPGVFL